MGFVCLGNTIRHCGIDMTKAEKYDVLVKELFRLLDITEETDDGRVFRPNRISSCRALDAEKLNQVLVELKRTLEDWG